VQSLFGLYSVTKGQQAIREAAKLSPKGRGCPPEGAEHGAGDSFGSAEMKFRLIADQRETFLVRVMCDVTKMFHVKTFWYDFLGLGTFGLLHPAA
jgi:hypothetical protein